MCPNLVNLGIKECDGVTNEGMKALAGGNLSLVELDVTDSDVEYDGICYILGKMPSLQILKYYNMADTLSYVHEMEYITGAYKNIQYNLTEMIYEGVTLCDDPLQVIHIWTTMCPKVKKVHILFPVPEEVLQTCSGFQHLEELNFKVSFDDNYTRIRDILVPISPIVNTLKVLYLSCIRLPTVSFLETLKNLNYLSLSDVQFTDFESDDIKMTENKLHTLVVKNTNFDFPSTFKGLCILLSVSKNVTKLHLNRISSVSEDLINIITNSMKNLTFLDLSFCNVKLSSVYHFFRSPPMRLIYLDFCDNCFSFNYDNYLQPFLRQTSPCTLSWRTLADSDDDDSDGFSVWSD